MAQLTDDCFAFGGPLLSVDDAIALVRERTPVISGIENVSLSKALNRILAEDAFARVAVPPFDNSAVDGYAVRHADLDLAGETTLPVAGRLPAGTAAVAPILPHTAVRIFTGAPMPEGADTVFMQEDVQHENGVVILPFGLKKGSNRRFSGEDFQTGKLAVHAGTRLEPRHLAALAATGFWDVRVHRRLKVALFSTGDELAEPGSALRPGAQYDSNRVMLAALLSMRGADVSDLGILPDNGLAVRAALENAAAGHDLILTSGGVSTGEEDHVKQAVEACGRLNFWRLAIKPGRPVAMGTIKGAAFVGLPGNPVASFVTFVRLAGPLADHMAGGRPGKILRFPVEAAFAYRKKSGRREYIRTQLVEMEDGRLRAQKFAREGAALISSLVETEGLVELFEDTTDIREGMTVSFIPYNQLI